MKIAVVFCTWKRVYRLKELLTNLTKQTYSDFDIFIWNNNNLEKNNIESIVKEFNLNIEIKHSQNNIGGIGRFYYSKEICNNYDKIIFIDDDQIIGVDVIEKMIKNHKEKTILSWWGWVMNSDYFNRLRVNNFNSVDYCGTGGMIIDSNIFKTINLETIPNKYKFIEDLWLSFVAKYEFGYDLIGGNFNIEIKHDGNDQFNSLIPLKIEFYKYLNEKYNKNINL
jgi:hypothetical protein